MPALRVSSKFLNFLGDTTFLIKRHKFLNIGFTDYFRVGREDYEFVHYCLERGLQVDVVSSAEYFYRLMNSDKIGRQHLTHKSKSGQRLDFGSFRRIRRSVGSFTRAKEMQLNAQFDARNLFEPKYNVSKKAAVKNIARSLMIIFPLL